MEKDFHSWEQIETLTQKVVAQINREDYDAILAITRGGMIPACLVSEMINLRNILTAAVMFYTDVGETLDEPRFLQFPGDVLLFGKRILIVDDVWDTGRTAMAVRQRVEQAGGKPTLAVLHYKPKRSKFPDCKPEIYAMETDAWIVYPWDPERERLAQEENVKL